MGGLHHSLLVVSFFEGVGGLRHSLVGYITLYWLPHSSVLLSSYRLHKRFKVFGLLEGMVITGKLFNNIDYYKLKLYCAFNNLLISQASFVLLSSALIVAFNNP